MHRFLPFGALALSLLAVPARAQETINNASLAGRVTDSTGAVVRNATVTARGVSTGLMTTGITDSAGRFRFAYLKVGEYEVTVHDAGFSDVKRSLTLTVGAGVRLARHSDCRLGAGCYGQRERAGTGG